MFQDIVTDSGRVFIPYRNLIINRTINSFLDAENDPIVNKVYLIILGLQTSIYRDRNEAIFKKSNR